MIKVDVFSGFLGAGKTTLIKKLIKEVFSGEKVVLIENEFGEIGIDGGFLKSAGVEITEMNSGCICCSLVGDFEEALKKVVEDFSPDRILIEPSGVGKLSDIIKAVKDIKNSDLVLNSATAVADAKKCKMYMKNFGEFFNDQIECATCIVMSHTKNLSEEKIADAVKMIREHNGSAVIITTDWDELEGKKILEAIEGKNTLKHDVEHLHDDCHEHHHHHGHECSEHNHHHDDCCAHEHHRHHDEGDEYEHHHGHCHHEHHHDADEVFVSWGKETVRKYSAEDIKGILDAISDSENYGIVLRAKGIVESPDGKWINFDYIPGEPDVREGVADITGKICVIGSKINEKELEILFGLN